MGPSKDAARFHIPLSTPKFLDSMNDDFNFKDYIWTGQSTVLVQCITGKVDNDSFAVCLKNALIHDTQ